MTPDESLPAHLAWLNALATAMTDTAASATASADDTEEKQ